LRSLIWPRHPLFDPRGAGFGTGQPLGTKHAVFSLHHTGSSLPATELGPPLIRKVTAVNKVRALDTRRKVTPSLDTPTDLPDDAVRALSAKLNEILADAFALYLKTKNFHWHMSGPHFRDYHLLLDEQSEQILGTTDDIAERVRKIGGTTLRSIGHISKLQNVQDNDETFVPAHEMLRELMADNKMVAASMRECHELAEKHEDAATAGLLENFIDGTERRTWFLFEASRAVQK
jgi:starvation-inducible DNA-binding protein